ncbi:MAG: DUF2953 domain-containing protein [Lachnospiraceae bacterium]|nr:DUF2953 domain-containing protein [Lachnospiraceae bacterium]
MSILLTLLKIIGILLLTILGLILAILLIVLLVPIRYRLNGVRSPGDGVITASGKVSWLASILAVTFGYDQEFSWKIRIFGIPLKRKNKDIPEDEVEDLTASQEAEIAALEAELAEENAPAPAAEGHASLSAADEHTSTSPAEASTLVLQTQEMSQGETNAPKTGSQGTAQKEAATDTEDPSAMADDASQAVTEDEDQKVPVGQRIKDILHSLSDKMRSIRETLASIPDKIRSIKQQADTWIAFAKSDEVKLLISTCWKQIKQILRHLLPTKLRIQGNYGFADPSLTGQITGILCMLPEQYQKNIHLQPHFQEECLDGECMLKGRIRLGSLVWPVIKILLKPCTWKVYKRFKMITAPTAVPDKGPTIKSNPKTKTNPAAKSKGGKQNKTKQTTNQNDPHKGGK